MIELLPLLALLAVTLLLIARHYWREHRRQQHRLARQIRLFRP
jgi:hypothetical protein